MTPIEQIKKAGSDLLSELVANEQGHGSSNAERTRMFNDWEAALAALSTIEGSAEPVALSDEDFERMDDAFMRDGYPDHHTGTRIGRTHYMMWLRDKGHLKTSPSLSVDEVMEVVEEGVSIPIERYFDAYGSHVTKKEIIAVFHELLIKQVRERLTKAIKP